MLYLPIRLVEYSVDPEISRSARKLTQTPKVIKKTKKKALFFQIVKQLCFILFLFFSLQFDKIKFHK
jgi:hypothetical protein